MRYRLFYVFAVFFLSGLVSCRSTKPVANNYVRQPVKSATDYVSQYKDLAINEMKRTGIPASITLAQGIIESDYGRSRLAREANNHFGIKCHRTWTGSTIKHNDNADNECFRKYGKAEESYYDHSDFLKSGSRYSFLFNFSATDYKSWAYGLKKAGYATNPDYANMLIRTIESNNLSSFDQPSGFSGPPVIDTVRKSAIATPQAQPAVKSAQTPARPEMVVARAPRIKENNKIQYIVVKDSDTREKIENEFQLLKGELPRYNELNSDFRTSPGQILYLQPKKDKAEAGKEYYNATEEDTMHSISQLFGIKLKKLYELNRMEEGMEPEAGRKIWLRNVRPAE